MFIKYNKMKLFLHQILGFEQKYAIYVKCHIVFVSRTLNAVTIHIILSLMIIGNNMKIDFLNYV